MLQHQPAARLAIRSLYRRSLRAAQACIDDQRSFGIAWVRSRFENSSATPGSHQFQEKLNDGESELKRFVIALQAKQRLGDESARRLLDEGSTTISQQPSDLPSPYTDAGIAPSSPATDWGSTDVGAWLGSLGLHEHIRAFAANHVDGRLLLRLGCQDFSELGVSSRLQRKLLLSRCDALRDNVRKPED